MIKELQEKIKNKEVSVLEIAKDYLKTIKEKDGDIKAFLTLTEDLALKQAKEIDKEYIQTGKLPILAGMPCAIKDNMLVSGYISTSGSKILENYNSAYDATVIKKLKASGAIILGKTNLDEFAMGSSTENSGYFSTKNPHDLERVPGGSSGGSAAAVAANMVVFGLGSDTGGSVRQPAAFCGVVGFKPSYGAVSRYGLMAMASSLDQIGPFAKSVSDIQLVFEVICGKDEMDSTSLDLKKYDGKDFKKARIGVPREYFIGGIDPEIELSIKAMLEKLQSQGADIIETSLPHTTYGLPCYYIIMPAEVSANLARYDGLRYSPLSDTIDKNDTLTEVYLKNRGEGFGKEVRRRIILGTYVLSAGYYDAYYLKAQKVRQLIKNEFDKVFEKVDFIITPTTPTPAFMFGEKTKDPVSMYLSDIFTVSANLAGLPAISLPSGKTKNNLPIGLQIMGPALSDWKLLSFAQYLEGLINYHE